MKTRLIGMVPIPPAGTVDAALPACPNRAAVARNATAREGGEE